MTVITLKYMNIDSLKIGQIGLVITWIYLIGRQKGYYKIQDALGHVST